MAKMFSFRVSIVAMPTLISPVAVASNTHCGRGSVLPSGVQLSLTSCEADSNTSDREAGAQDEL